MGKTRLGLQVAAELADEYADGVWFVRLSRLTDPALVLPTIAQTLGLREAGNQPIAALLRDYLLKRHLLLLLDNFEQVVGAAAEVADLLASSPGLTVLVTSRAGLHLRSEKEYPVAPLALPPASTSARRRPALEQVTPFPAVALFLQRAQDSRPDFQVTDATATAVAAICARLDGLPLAIELAAARVKVLSPLALLQRLEQRMPLLRGGARDLEERQQTMWNTLAWSEDLLSLEDRRLFRRLAVFVGGWMLEAAEAVCAMPERAEPLRLDVLEGLETLVDQNLIWRREEADGAEVRLGMRQVTREYALERLEASGEAEALRLSHAAYCLGLAEAAAPELWRSDQVAWLDRLEREHDNLRAALGWAQERGMLELGTRLAVALYKFWVVRGYYSEGRRWLEGLLASAPLPAEQSGAGMPEGLRANALAMSGFLAFIQEDYGPAAAQLEAGLSLARQADDKLAAVFALSGLAELTRVRGDLERATAHHEEMLVVARELDDARTISIAHALLGQGAVASARGDWAQAAVRFEEARALAREYGDLNFVAFSTQNLGRMALRRGDLRQAAARLWEALRLYQTVGNQVRVAGILEELAMTAAASGQAEQVARLLGAKAVLQENIGMPILPAEWADIYARVSPARAALGEDAWVAAFAAGQALSREEAIAEALGEDEGEAG